MSNVYMAQYVLLILGMVFAGYWAYEAFDTRPIKLGDSPALPRYMTQPSQYRLGATVFVGTCLLVYTLIAYFHQDLMPIVGALNPELQHTIEKSMKDGSLSYPLIVIFSAAIFVSLLKIEKDWNPIFVLRRVVHGWISIPQIANALMVMMRDELVVPVDARANVTDDPDTPYVTTGDFDKDRRSLDRRWAELCYIRLWLERHRAQGSHFTFFNEPSFAWEQLQADYYSARDRIVPLKRVKQGDVTDTYIFEDVAGKVEFAAPPVLPARRLLPRLQERDAEGRPSRRQTVRGDDHAGCPARESSALHRHICRNHYHRSLSRRVIVSDELGPAAPQTSHNGLRDRHEVDVLRPCQLRDADYGGPFAALSRLEKRSKPAQFLPRILCDGLPCLALRRGRRRLAIAQMIAGQVTMDGFGQQLYKNVKWGISPAVVSHLYGLSCGPADRPAVA